MHATQALPSLNGARTNPSVAHFASLPDEALVDVAAFAVLTGKSKNTIWRMARDGVIAAPIKAGPRATRWRAGDVRAYLNSLS